MRRALGPLGAVLVLAVLLVGCGRDEKPLADELSRYTDGGDGCQQSVAAITYADSSLRAAGQERHEGWDDATRSKVATVGGTIALEVRDFPSEATLEQARKVADIAADAAAAATTDEERVTLLREYRREAAQLVILCGREVPDL
jgi:hypothetical protein